MGSLARKMQRAAAKAARKNKLGPSFRKTAEKRSYILLTTIEDMAPDLPGIHCDCYGTLYSHSMEKNDLLVSYLNAQYESGTPVTLVSSVPVDVLPHIKNIGLHEDILKSLRDKFFLSGDLMEILIDDDPAILSAKKIWHPDDPLFRQHMRDYLEKRHMPPPEPAAP